jgi:hypothetical protein
MEGRTAQGTQERITDRHTAPGRYIPGIDIHDMIRKKGGYHDDNQGISYELD